MTAAATLGGGCRRHCDSSASAAAGEHTIRGSAGADLLVSTFRREGFVIIRAALPGPETRALRADVMTDLQKEQRTVSSFMERVANRMAGVISEDCGEMSQDEMKSQR
jgi:hypothetical protein